MPLPQGEGTAEKHSISTTTLDVASCFYTVFCASSLVMYGKLTTPEISTLEWYCAQYNTVYLGVVELSDLIGQTVWRRFRIAARLGRWFTLQRDRYVEVDALVRTRCRFYSDGSGTGTRPVEVVSLHTASGKICKTLIPKKKK